MILLSRFIGQDSVSLRSADKTGAVKGIGISGNRIVSVGLSDGVISASAVRSFEGDVVTYEERDDGAETTEVQPIDPRGMLVLDMNGDGVGSIADLMITADGTIDSVVLDNGDSVDGTRLRALGSYAAVLNVDLPPPSGTPAA